jgi:TonB-linked SusC/RagA family outer membrane protein
MRKIIGKQCNGVNFTRGLFVILFLLTSVTFALAQGNKVTGTLKDLRGGPIIGAFVLVKGTTNGTVTDINGFYSITYKDVDPTLVFSFMGFLKKEVKINGRTVVDDVLYDDEKQLNEVVIVGYGKQKKISVTGAVASVQNKELKQSTAPNFGAVLSGRITGLTSLQVSGQPGYDDVVLYLRGRSTMNDASPLILIDGVPRSDIGSLDPNEVESVTVLKDASATAVYGVRGANGVLIVTTRRGTSTGVPEVNATVTYSMQQIFNRPKHIDSWDYAMLENQAYINDNWRLNLSDDLLPNSSFMIDKYRQGGDFFYPNRDGYKEAIADFAPQVRSNVSLSGGNKQAKYFVNAGYLYQGSLLKTEDPASLGYDPGLKLNRFNVRANLDYKISKYLKGWVNLSTIVEKANSPNSQYLQRVNNGAIMADVFSKINEQKPYYPGPYVPAGSVDALGRELPSYPYPMAVIQQTYLGSLASVINRRGYVTETRMNLESTAGLELDLGFLTNGLSTKFMISYDTYPITTNYSAISSINWQATAVPAKNENQTSYFGQIDPAMDWPSLQVARSASSYYKMNMQYAIDYSRTFMDNHAVTAMVTLTRDNWVNNSNSPDLPYNVLGIASRVTYAYNNKYLAELNMGYNGSEQFAPSNRFGFFPAISGGWIISNENFMSSKSDILSNLKLRASYGISGNDKIGGQRFLYLDNTTISDIPTDGNPYGFPSLGNGKVLQQISLGNPNIGWEEARKQNYGVELGLFGNLSLIFDYFRENRSKILIARNTVPILQGYPLNGIPKVNMGEMENHGYELEVAYKKRFSRDFFVSLGGNFAFSRNKVINADEPRRVDESYYEYRIQGFSLNQNWGYLINWEDGSGYFHNVDEISNYKNTKGNLVTYNIGSPRPGDFKYMDLNEDGVIDQKDLAPIGYTNVPEITYASNLSANYKGFDIAILLQGIAHASSMYYSGMLETSGQFTPLHLQAWTKEREANSDPFVYPALSSLGGSVSVTGNDFFIQNRNYLRLKNMEFGYTLPQTWLNRAKIKSLRMAISANNLFTWHNLKVNSIDPENAPDAQNGNGLGFPLVRTYNLSLSITL